MFKRKKRLDDDFIEIDLDSEEFDRKVPDNKEFDEEDFSGNDEENEESGTVEEEGSVKSEKADKADASEEGIPEAQEENVPSEEEEGQKPPKKTRKAKRSRKKELENEEAENEKAEKEASEEIELTKIDLEEEPEAKVEETEEEKAIRRHKRRKTAAIICGSFLGALAAVYLGFAFYFDSHFMFYTTINGTDFSMQNVSQVEEYMKKQVTDYSLTLEESGGAAEQIAGRDIALEYVPSDELTQCVKKQDKFLWPKSLWEHPKIQASIGVKYDEAALAAVVSSLACMQAENQTPSVDAHPAFGTTAFEVVPEVIGTQIDAEKFYAALTEALNGFQEKVNLSECGVYLLPRFVSDSTEVLAAAESMNSYLGAQVTYDFNPNTEVVDSAVIAQWVKVNENMEVTFDEEAVKTYIASLAEKYDTKGKPRQFTTATGNTVTVEGGKYGWLMDQEAEYEALIANIQNAETVTREPAYKSRAASHGAMDVGSTYAEVDLSNQKAYFIKDGQVVLESDVVTGNPNKGNATPQGTYSLTYKTRNAVLRGERKPDGTYSYESPVKYWMPFNGGIGFHDASWQSAFGGSRYKSHGSHGCVNMPTSKAAEMYDLISDGIPVVCHY